GITIDEAAQKIYFDLDDFYAGLEKYFENSENHDYLSITPDYSVVYHEFLKRPDLGSHYAIRGQQIGPISFGMKITDKDKKPIIYNNEIKQFLYDFMARKANVQFHQLREKNPNAFVWIDEPGLQILFGSFTGYSSNVAKEDFKGFLGNLEGPKGVHLCGNPDWSFLLEGLDLDILSIDVFANGPIFTKYSEQIKAFLERGGIISWGLVPTLTEELVSESVDSLQNRLEEMWDYLDKHGIDKGLILKQAWLAPARCCLVNADGAKSVEKSYAVMRELAERLKDKYNLD
ncbi:MAG: hypothetical protein ACOY4Q_10180, partial [Bacillota bacterium]